MKIKLSLVNGGGDVKTVAFLFSVKMAAYLRFIVMVIHHACWILDYGDVSMFGDMSRPLAGYTVCNDTQSNTLHQFQFWNVPIVDDLVFFSAVTPRLGNGLLVNVESTQGSLYLETSIFMNSLSLHVVAKIHQRMNGNEKVF